MANVRITHANFSNGDTHEHITHVGDGKRKWPVGDVIRSIQKGIDQFYLVEPKTGKRADLAINISNGNVFLQAKVNGVWSNSLLKLPPHRD